MGNQQSVMYQKAVYEDEGRYIVPTKIKIPEQTQEIQTMKNIFGVQDPTLLARSYWAKNTNKSRSQQRQLSKSPSKSKGLLQSSVVTGSRHLRNDWARQSLAQPQRQVLKRSIVSNFKQDLKDTPARHLSKITSCSAISKLNQLEPELQSTSSIKINQKPFISSIFTYKNKQNLDFLGSPIPSSKRVRKTEAIQNFALKRSKFERSCESQVKSNNVMRQLNKVFGISNISENNQSKFNESLELSNKKLKLQMNHNEYYVQFQPTHEAKNHNASVSLNQEICEQTFSKFDQNPALICSSSQDKASQKFNFEFVSKKTYSKHSQIQKFDGLNDDSKNESLMKVLKRITQISIDNSVPGKKSSEQCNNFARQNTSQIFSENINQDKGELQQKQSSQSQNLKNELMQKYQEPPFQFVLYEGKKQPSKKSIHRDDSILSKQSSKFSQNQRNPIYSQAANTNSKSLSKQSIHRLTQTYQQNCKFNENERQKMFANLDNEESQETEYKNENSNFDFFKCSKTKSPRSITSEQVGLNRQRSCAGRIVQTSKAVNNTDYSSPFKSKKYDFTKKQASRHEKQISKHNCSNREGSSKSSIPNEIRFSKSQIRSPSQRSPTSRSPSGKSPTHKSSSKNLDYQLKMKISTLEGELKSLKHKEQLQKFQSRRYSPVKQEKQKKKISLKDYQNGSISSCQEEQSKYCINESKSTQFKHRAQYFKLKLK